MSAFQNFMKDILKHDSEFNADELSALNEIFQEAKDYGAKVTKEIEKFRRTGVFSVIGTANSRRDSSKENAEPNKNSIASGRPKRNAFKESNQINVQSDKVQDKDNEEPLLDKINVKTEKKSIPKQTGDDQIDLACVKTEKQEMPAPTKLPPRRRKVKAEPPPETRSTRSRAKRVEQTTSDVEKEKPSKRTKKKTARSEDTSGERKDSDVILHNSTLTTVELSDTDDSSSENTVLKNTVPSQGDNSRATRTKTRNNKKLEATLVNGNEQEESVPSKSKNRKAPTKSKRGRIESSDDDSQQQDKRENKRSKSDSDESNTDSTNSVAAFQAQQNNTVVIEKDNPELAQKNTEVVENGTNDMADSDESDGVEYNMDRIMKKKSKGGSRNVPKNNVDDEPKSPEKERIMDTTMVIEKEKEQIMDTTMVIEKEKERIMDTTMVVENPKYTSKTLKSIERNYNNMNNLNNVNKDLMTDDESEEEIIKSSPLKTNSKKTQGKGIKQVFSPFDPSPVKKKVEAYERLGAEASAIPRITRTKTRAQTKDQKEGENKDQETEACPAEPKNTVKEKAKLFTPTISRFMPKTCSTSKLTHKLPSHSSSILNESNNYNSILSTKSASALKSSQAEFREREKQRREKESEALKKREAMIQAQIEEKKRKREEKQIKAQQQREALEKETQRKLEAQKIKEEKYKKLMAEREERLQKQREESERKRLMAKKKAMEERKKEEAKRAEEQKKQEEINPQKVQKEEIPHEQQPIYMTRRPPLLPTDDCYDSDDSRYETHRPRQPDWAYESELRATQLCMVSAGEKLKNTFFCCQAETPDLQEIFELIDPKKLKRTSSAIWRKPPRYTLMPTLDQHIEDSDEYDDD